METRNSFEEQKSIIKEIISLYQKIEELLRNDEYSTVIPSELHKYYPNYLNQIANRRNDIRKSDHGVVIAGETSAGKTILVNKILKKRIFICENHESTSTICKIRNSDGIKIITESNAGKKETNLTDLCDLSTEAGVAKLRECLERSTKIQPLQRDMYDEYQSGAYEEYQYVDVGLPIPFLKGNIILVDTPGIGGSGTVTHKVIEYLPNAVSFIFVIDAGKAGGMQVDRLPEILKTITLLELEGNISFDAKDAIFLTNKWDTIRCEVDDEKARERTWGLLQKDIKRAWKAVREENIFRMNLIEVSPGKTNPSVTEFKRFKRVLEANIKNAENVRVKQHMRFLETFLSRLSRILSMRLHLGEKSESEQQLLTERHQKNIRELTKKCEQIGLMSLSRMERAIDNASHRCHQRMLTDKELILNPDGENRLSSYTNILTYPRVIHKRVVSFINEFLQSDEVLQEIENIKEDLKSKCQEIAKNLCKMENDWIENTTSETVPISIDLPNVHYEFSLLDFVRLIFSLTFLISPFSEEKKEATANSIYDTYTSKIKDMLFNHLQSNQGSMFKKIVERVTKEFLPRWINSLEATIEILQEERVQILKNQTLLADMKMRVEELQDSVEKITSPQEKYNMKTTTGMF